MSRDFYDRPRLQLPGGVSRLINRSSLPNNTLMSVYANILSQVISGVPIQKISMPASMRQKCSVLEVNASQLFHNLNCLKAYDSIPLEKDGFARIALLLQGLISVEMPFESAKPYDPVKGEFYEAYYQDYCLKLEHLGCTINPASKFEITGKNWEIKSDIIKPGKTKLGFNSIKITFPGEAITFTSGGYKLSYQYPGIKVDNLTSWNRNGGFHGDFWILDHVSGAKFEGQIVKPFKIVGNLKSGTTGTVQKVDGSMKDGVRFCKDKKLWISPIGYSLLEVQFREKVLQDPMFTRNVWKEVYDCIEKENFDQAEDIRKRIEKKFLDFEREE